MSAMKMLSLQEMEAAECEAARLLRVYVDMFVAFPTAHNFDLTADKMREFQTAWMNGRTRKCPTEGRE